MHQPRVGDARRAKRLLRYVAGTRDMVCLIRPTGNDSGHAKIDVWTDADLGGCDDTRGSTSGGVIFLNGVMIHVWSKQQPTVALSSAEAEFVALCLATTESLFVVQFLSELGVPFQRPVIHADSKAALDMVTKTHHWPRKAHG